MTTVNTATIYWVPRVVIVPKSDCTKIRIESMKVYNLITLYFLLNRPLHLASNCVYPSLAKKSVRVNILHIYWCERRKSDIPMRGGNNDVRSWKPRRVGGRGLWMVLPLGSTGDQEPRASRWGWAPKNPLFALLLKRAHTHIHSHTHTLTPSHTHAQKEANTQICSVR
jgi:hypothetical protein